MPHIDVRESLLVEIRSWILSEFQFACHISHWTTLKNWLLLFWVFCEVQARFGFCILCYQQAFSNKPQISMFYVHELQSRYLQSRSIMYTWYKCSYVFTSTLTLTLKKYNTITWLIKLHGKTYIRELYSYTFCIMHMQHDVLREQLI